MESCNIWTKLQMTEGVMFKLGEKNPTVQEFCFVSTHPLHSINSQ